MNSYLRLFFGMSMVSPLVFAFWALDFDNWTAFWITFIMYSILYSLGVMMFNYLQNGNLFVFELGRKWELYKENMIMDETQFNPLWGMGVINRKVIADVYRKKQRNGIYKYKTIVKS